LEESGQELVSETRSLQGVGRLSPQHCWPSRQFELQDLVADLAVRTGSLASSVEETVYRPPVGFECPKPAPVQTPPTPSDFTFDTLVHDPGIVLRSELGKLIYSGSMSCEEIRMNPYSNCMDRCDCEAIG